MAENGVEASVGQSLNPDVVIQSIKQTELWWPNFQEVLAQDKEEIILFIGDALRLYREIEEAALNPQAHFPNAEEVSKIKALWVIAGPGTYFKARKKDRYEDKSWAAWNDRQRINYALNLGRRLAYPLIVYSGRPDEDAAVLEAKKVPWLRFPIGTTYPKDRILVINPIPSIDNLLDQVKTFRLPYDFKINAEDEIGVVIHSPQAMRFLYQLNKFPEVIPQGVKIRIFPLPTPVGGIPEYPLQEIRGLINYRYIKNPPTVAATAYPHKM